MEYKNALKIAELLTAKMSDYSERILIAGSIRRKKAECRDIEIIAVPKWSKEIPEKLRVEATVKKPQKKPESEFSPMLPCNWELFGDADKEKSYIPPDYSPEPLNLLYLWGNRQNLIRWIKPGVGEAITWRIVPDGRYWRGIVESETHLPIKLDLFLCQPENWGVISTIRTGPAGFSSAMMATIRNRTRFQVDGGFLTVKETGEQIPCFEETDFFTNCGFRYVPVSERSAANPYVLFQVEK